VLAGLVVALAGLLFLVAGLAGQLVLSSFYAGSGVLVRVLIGVDQPTRLKLATAPAVTHPLRVTWPGWRSI